MWSQYLNLSEAGTIPVTIPPSPFQFLKMKIDLILIELYEHQYDTTTQHTQLSPAIKNIQVDAMVNKRLNFVKWIF